MASVYVCVALHTQVFLACWCAALTHSATIELRFPELHVSMDTEWMVRSPACSRSGSVVTGVVFPAVYIDGVVSAKAVVWQ